MKQSPHWKWLTALLAQGRTRVRNVLVRSVVCGGRQRVLALRRVQSPRTQQRIQRGFMLRVKMSAPIHAMLKILTVPPVQRWLPVDSARLPEFARAPAAPPRSAPRRERFSWRTIHHAPQRQRRGLAQQAIRRPSLAQRVSVTQAR
jgi:hypothetical protein